jgi:hypothetical protein
MIECLYLKCSGNFSQMFLKFLSQTENSLICLSNLESGLL